MSLLKKKNWHKLHYFKHYYFLLANMREVHSFPGNGKFLFPSSNHILLYNIEYATKETVNHSFYAR